MADDHVTNYFFPYSWFICVLSLSMSKRKCKTCYGKLVAPRHVRIDHQTSSFDTRDIARMERNFTLTRGPYRGSFHGGGATRGVARFCPALWTFRQLQPVPESRMLHDSGGGVKMLLPKFSGRIENWPAVSDIRSAFSRQQRHSLPTSVTELRKKQ